MKKMVALIMVLFFAASSGYAETMAEKLKGMLNKGKSAEDKSAESQLDAMNKRNAEKNAPTGFLYREFTIRQVNLGGKWDKAEIKANPRFEAGYQYMKEDTYKTSLNLGTTNVSGSFTEFAAKMKAKCKEDAKPGAKLTVRLYDKNPEWSVFKDNLTARITHRELYFQCLGEGERVHEQSL